MAGSPFGEALSPPNLLTLLRIGLTPFVVISMLAEDYRRAFVFVMIAGLTDAFDGRLARAFHWETQLGAYLDPVADKLLLTAIYGCFWITQRVPTWLVCLIVGRDLLILAMAGFALLFTKFRQFPPTIWGKMNTALQILTALALIVEARFPATVPEWLTSLLLWLTGLSTLWSGIHYVARAAKMWIMRRNFLPADRRGARG
jgi:cardiolipin synthase